MSISDTLKINYVENISHTTLEQSDLKMYIGN